MRFSFASMPARLLFSRLLFSRILVVFLIFGMLGCGRGGDSATRTTHTDPASIQYVGREVCAGCHEQAAAEWQGSHHDEAMSPATSQSVLGDFDDATFVQCGVETRFHREDSRYLISTEGPHGKHDTFEVRYTFGFDPLQQYLIALPGGRLQSFTVAWDTAARRWFSLYEEECVTPEDPLHWSGRAMNWNYMCADCHSTNLERNFRLDARAYETTYSEVDVSCESCHGPGEDHVKWAEAIRVGAQRDAGAHTDAAPEDSASQRASDIRLTADLSSQRGEIEVCAPCHSRRRSIYPDHVPGSPYLDHYEPEVLTEDLYYTDGQIKDEVYVYGSFLQSRMHREGVRCTDCHDPHSTRLKMQGNALCTQCHEASVFDTFDHIRHERGTEGSQCVDCHMPERTYMVVDPRRDHSFTVPRPDLTSELGVPNACSGCHADESPGWATDAVSRWHGPDRGSSHVIEAARALTVARERGSDADSLLVRLIRDTDHPGIVRATALHSLRDVASAYSRAGDPRYRNPAADSYSAVRAALRDPDALVRVHAVRTVEHLPERETIELLRPLVGDSVRLVRMEAARILANTSLGRFTLRSTTGAADGDGAGSVRSTRAAGESDDFARAFRRAVDEYRSGQWALADQPASHLNLAVLHEARDETTEAEEAYRTALRLDSSFVPAHINLAMLYSRRRSEGRRAAADRDSLGVLAERELRSALVLQPDLASAHYSLGLLLAEGEEALADAAEHLVTAARLSSEDARIHYNTGLALQRLGRPSEAEPFLKQAYDLDPANPDYLNALSILYAQEERWEDALHFTELLATRAPDAPSVRQRLEYIRSMLATSR